MPVLLNNREKTDFLVAMGWPSLSFAQIESQSVTSLQRMLTYPPAPNVSLGLIIHPSVFLFKSLMRTASAEESI